MSRIEDLGDAVYGAGLTATQMSAGITTGSLVHAEGDGILYSSGLIGGRVKLSGSLSPDLVTLGACLRIEGPSSHWCRDVGTGTTGAFLPGDEHDALYAPGSVYAAVTLSRERLETEAARADLVLDDRVLGGTGIHPMRLAAESVAAVRDGFERIHRGAGGDLGGRDAGELLLRVLIAHHAREARGMTSVAPDRYARIVTRACAHIEENLATPIRVDAVASAARTSRRTLCRAFLHRLGESPHSYARKLRLNSIRRDLLSDTDAANTIALVANQWGVSQLGRLSVSYRELFGESPSHTRAVGRRVG